MYVLGKM